MSRNMHFLILLFLVSFVPLFDLLPPGLPLTHDGQDHVARIANFYQNLSEGNIVPRWAGNLNWGYGHPILMFLYPLPSYMASLFHFLGFSLVDSTKIVFAVAYILSGLAMYLWVSQFLGRRAAFAASMLYLFAPYRFVDLYVRGAIGEHMAFVFLPLIMYFFLKLSKKYSYWYFIGGSLSLAGLILSHNAISLMFLPIIFLYAAYVVWQSKQKQLIAIRYTLIAILGFGLSAFFWFPAFFEGKYTLRDIVIKGEYASRFIPFQSFLYGEWNYGISGEFSVQVGIVHWVMMVASFLSITYLRRQRISLWVVGAALLIIFWLTLILMTSSSKFVWEALTILQKFQFPWRFLSVTIFSAAVLGGLVILTIPKRFQLAVCYSLLVTLLLVNKDYWHANGYLLKPESFFTDVYAGTTDTGESSPIWSVRFMEREPDAHIEVISGEALVREARRLSALHEYVVDAKERSRIRENTLYFPGWEVWVDGQKLPTSSIEFQDPTSRGLMTFFIDQGKHSIKIWFRETKLRKFADAASIIAFLMLISFVLLSSRRRILI